VDTADLKFGKEYACTNHHLPTRMTYYGPSSGGYGFKGDGWYYALSGADVENSIHPLIDFAKEQKARESQVGGDHYKSCAIQPIEYIHKNGLGYFEGNVVKYITRHKQKNGKQDLLKAKHYIDLLIELEYGDAG
jgi:hypothetical protein